MVDKALFVDMTGAKEAMRGMRIVANNLANANTIGFQADFELMKSKSAETQNSFQTRVHAVGDKTYSSFNQGPMITTGRDLDIAIEGKGFIAVQAKDGSEAFTRAGNLNISPEGFLVTSAGELVLGEEGVIAIPEATHLNIGQDGTITAQLKGQSEKDLSRLGRIKLVDIPTKTLQKGQDGLFRQSDGGQIATRSDNVKLVNATLEGSNVDPVNALTQLIDLSRQFELHSKLMKTVEENTMKSNQLLDATR